MFLVRICDVGIHGVLEDNMKALFWYKKLHIKGMLKLSIDYIAYITNGDDELEKDSEQAKYWADVYGLLSVPIEEIEK